MENKNSFIFYETFYEVLKELPPESRLKFYEALSEYGLLGIEPEFSGVEKALWIQLKYGIDKAKERYNRSVENGKRGGRPVKPTENLNKPTENLNKPTDNLNVNVNVNDNVNENVNTENPTLSPSLPPQSYADAVFDIFQEAGLPCCNKNKLTFWQRDFKNALEYIHNAPDLRGLHSDAIIGACCNYVRTINDPQSYLKNKYSFDRLVKTKNFKDFLPDNYVPDNFKRWDTKDEVPKEKPIAPAADPFAFVPDTPTVCLCGGKLTRENHGAGLLYVKCKTCGRWAEHDPLKDGWEWSDAG